MATHEPSQKTVSNIDGFQVIRRLDEHEPPNRFLVRRSDGAEAAVLKLLPPESAESQILHQVNHPHICQFLGSGGDTQPYVLTAYYGGPDLRAHLQRGIKIKVLLEIVLQLADALDSLHSRGFVHGDLRPEHISIKANGQPVIVDLSSAFTSGSASDLEVRTTGPSMAYLSPERRVQAAKSESASLIDGACDYFSLGVMAFELLSGRLPPTEETAQGGSQPYLQDSPPRLPAHLQSLQPIIDRLMAKDPDKRLGSRDALQQLIGLGGIDPELGDMVIRHSAISVEELSSLFADLRLRPDELARQNKRLRRKRRRRIALQGSLALILTGSILAGLLTFREALLPVVEDAAAYLGIIENPELTAAWREAQSLASDPNQGLSTIVAAYRRVITIAPGYTQAAEALEQTTQAWKRSIADAMNANELSRAEVLLNEAQGLFESDPELTVLSLRLQNHRRAERLLASTQSLLRSSGLSDEASAAAAVQAFEEILRISPDNAEAAQGLTDISRHYGELAAEAAKNRDVDQAIRLLQRATAARSDLRELDRVRELISEATSIQSAMAALVLQAQQLSVQGNLIEPAGDNAAEVYLQVLAIDPQNLEATAGLSEVTVAVMANALALLDQGDIQGAQYLLNLGESQNLDAIPLANMRERIDSEITRRSQVAIALEQASVLFAQGYITAPKGQDAVSRLREVLLLDPGNEVAQTRLIQCAERLATVAVEAQEVGITVSAKAYIEEALSIHPGVSQWEAWQAQW
ncbi:MAG: protein kinase [Pseudomonadales bacterium]|nr:protein kinase [Pseudomonadales bacterium]